MTDKPIWNKTRVAQELGCNVRTLHDWLKNGQCPVPPIPGMSPPKWRASDVQAFLAGGSAA